MADVGFGKVEVVADDGDERGRGEGGQEASEEGDPRQMESAHVRRRDTIQTNGLGLVLGVHREGEFRRGWVGRFRFSLQH